MYHCMYAYSVLTSTTKLLMGRLGLPGTEVAFSVQLLISAPVCLLISRTLEPDGPAGTT